MKKYISFCVVIAMLLCLGMACTTRPQPINKILIDVNPSLSIDITQQEKVISVSAFNQDAKTLLDNMTLEGTTLTVALNALFGAMITHGYITILQNTVLVTVDCDSKEDALNLQEKVTDKLSILIASFNGNVVSQIATNKAEVIETANKYNISKGKAQIVEEIIQVNTEYSTQELANMDITSLTNIFNSIDAPSEDANYISKGNTKPLNPTAPFTLSPLQTISEEAAKIIAFNHANISETNVVACKVEKDFENSVLVYDVEFITTTHKYDVTVHAVNGAIIDYEVENLSVYATATPTNPITTPSLSTAPTNVPQPTYISEAEAINIAYDYAHITEKDVVWTHVEFKKDDGRMIYDVEFLTNSSFEYDVEVDAISGKVLSFDVDLNDTPPYTTSQPTQQPMFTNTPTITHNPTNSPTSIPITPNPTTNPNYIGVEFAKQIAFNHAGVSENSVYDFSIEFERKNGKMVYDIDFNASGYEYEYIIDAITGTILFSNKEIDDEYIHNTSSPTAAPNIITEAQAKKIALQRANVTESQISHYEIQLDLDDGLWVYEIEFRVKNLEYSITINASNGAILEFEIDD